MSAILDSGNRRTFQTGAVRDIQEGKGRCDLLPLLPIYNMLRDDILSVSYTHLILMRSDAKAYLRKPRSQE